MMNYDIDYYESMLRRYSGTAEQISKVRWDWIKEIKPKRVLDYGSGCGWFRAWRPKGVEVDSYDIADYPQTGINLVMYSVVCFWDVLEHIKDFKEIEPILALANYVAVAIPIKPKTVEYFNWKHLKPQEHIKFFDESAIDALFQKYGFRREKIGQPECPPREDITSILYRRE